MLKDTIIVQIYKSSLYGSINFFVNALTDEQNMNTLSHAGVTFEEYRKAYELQALEYSHEFGVRSVTSAWAKGFYDAVWVLAIALNDSLVHLNTSLTQYKPGSQLLAVETNY